MISSRQPRPTVRPFVEVFRRRRARMVGLIAGTGLLGGLVGAGYLAALHLVERVLGPSRWFLDTDGVMRAAG